jgi:cell wall-associated NlpC family hydrolase
MRYCARDTLEGTFKAQTTMTERFDPRITPARADLAAKSLEGTVTAARYVEGRLCEVVEPHAALRRAPAPDAPLDTEALMGERVVVYENNDEGWAWGQLAADRYVGWMPASALAPPGPPPTHKVTALRTLAFPGPSIKLPPTGALPFGARLAIVRREDRFAVTATGAFVPDVHLTTIDSAESDFVAVAERFLGTPYLWGGKTGFGIDCSGLVQVALSACGIACPRDSDMQERAFGPPIESVGDFAHLRRGDLVFWKGHVAIARDRTTLIHANAYHMAVAIEDTNPAIERIRAAGQEVSSVRRIGR